MEEWNDGGVEQWNDGILEYWEKRPLFGSTSKSSLFSGFLQWWNFHIIPFIL